MQTPNGDLISPWHPTTNTQELKVGLKFLEELGESVSAMARCLMQGINESQPVTGKLNREWLQDEIADVIGNAHLVIEWYDLDREAIEQRATRKKVGLRIWHAGA